MQWISSIFTLFFLNISLSLSPSIFFHHVGCVCVGTFAGWCCLFDSWKKEKKSVRKRTYFGLRRWGDPPPVAPFHCFFFFFLFVCVCVLLCFPLKQDNISFFSCFFWNVGEAGTSPRLDRHIKCGAGLWSQYWNHRLSCRVCYVVYTNVTSLVACSPSSSYENLFLFRHCSMIHHFFLTNLCFPRRFDFELQTLAPFVTWGKKRKKN